MEPKKSLREKFQEAGDSLTSSHTNPRATAIGAAVGLFVLPFNTQIAFAAWALPTILCGTGFALQKLAKIGKNEPKR